MAKDTDIRSVAASLYFLRVENRVPLKFGPEITTEVTCARVCVTVEDRKGRRAEGWGETPLSVAWVWPGTLSYSERHEALRAFTGDVVGEWIKAKLEPGHPLEIGHAFLERKLPALLQGFNRRERSGAEPVPWLAALVCASALDLAIHDAYGILHEVPIYETYNDRFMSHDLAHFLEPVAGSGADFRGRYPTEYLVHPRPDCIPAWHLVGGKDPVFEAERTGEEPDDGYPVMLRDWIRRDGLNCLKVKLRGDDAMWDYDRLVAVGAMAIEEGVEWLSADFNCTVHDPAYVVAILDRLLRERPRIYAMTLYVEQPFPYDLEADRIDVRQVSARKPLFLDESAHDWRMIRLGRELGWSGVALKTCKTQTGAILSLCWARAHGMTLMVQDLTNPMLAQVSHVLLAAHAGTIMGVETNGMQFYPEASRPEAVVHPGLYTRRDGQIDMSTVRGPGFGYRLDEIERKLSEPALQVARKD